MKKFVSLFMAFAMVLALALPASAAKAQATGTEKDVMVDGYTFTITEMTDTNKRIVRSYQNNANTNAKTAVDINETKALLVALGMQQKQVDNLSNATLQEFAEGSQIYVATAYIKADSNNNVTPLDEATALKESSALKELQDTINLNRAFGIATAADADYKDYFEDSYMRVDFAATYKGNGNYLYSVDGEWLTMPFFRGFDSIGACAMNGTVTNSTRSGNYSYDITYINGGRITYDSYSSAITNKKNAVNGNWYGSAGVINLPNDVYGDYSSIIYRNFAAHYEYQGHVTSPSEARWFNVIGTYDHATVSIAFDPSISIDLNGDVSASVGLSIVGTTDSRSVEFEIYYRP